MLSNPTTHQVHGTCSMDYYARASSALRERFPDAVLFIFSDDLPWAKENLEHFSPVEFVELEGPYRDQEELMLMSACRNHIIANSSFSWWGAWLNPSPEKLVIAPRRWGNDPTWTPVDIYPDGWTRM